MKPIYSSGTPGQTLPDSLPGLRDSSLKGSPSVLEHQDASLRATPPIESAYPLDADRDGEDNRCTTDAIPLDSRGIVDSDAAEAAHCGQPSPPAGTHGTATPTRRRATLTARQRHAARLDGEGSPVDAIVRDVPTTRSALARWRRLPAYQDAVRYARTAVRASTDSELETARLVAARSLRAILDKPEGLSTSEVAKAASVLLSASTPPGEQARRLAAREARGAWLAALAPEDPTVRTRVLARIDGDLDDPSITTAELEALAAKERGSR